MRRIIVGALAFLVFTAPPVRGQGDLLESCATPRVGDFPIEVNAHITQLCSQVVGAIADMQPSVGIAFSGGNPVLGTGSTMGTRLGMIPRVSVTARANAAWVDIPDVFAAGVGVVTPENPTVAPLGTVGLPVPAVQGDVAVGVFNGLDVGPTIGGLGSIDLLGSVTYVPQVEDFGLSEAIMNIGVGARVGILQQGLVMPGVSVSGMYRAMGGVQFGFIEEDGSGDPASFAANLQTWNVRGVVSKGLLMLDLALGAGYDAYTSDVDMAWQLECSIPECLESGASHITNAAEGTVETGAWNVFGNVALNLLMVNVVGELGYQKAMDRIDAEALDAIDADPDGFTTEELSGGRLFGSIGVRIAL